MKDYKSALKKRLLPSLLLLALGIVGSIVMYRVFHTQGDELWRLAVLLIAGVGTALGGVALLFLGWPGLLGAYGLMLVITLPRVLPKPYRGVSAILLLAAVLGVPPLLQWKNNRAGKKKDDGDEALPEKREYRIPKSSQGVFVFLPLSGHRYQIFRTGGRLLLYRCGGELTGIDPEKIQTAGTLRPLGKGDLELPADETMSVRVAEMSADNIYGAEKFILRSGRRRFRMFADGNTSEEDLKEFFRPYIREDRRSERRAAVPQTAPDKKRVRLLRRVFLILSIVTGVIDLPWLFLPVPYTPFAVLALLPTLACLVLMCVFPNDVTIVDTKKSETEKASCVILLGLSAIVPGIRALKDFNILDWKTTLIYSAVLLVVLIAALMIFTKEWRTRLSALTVVIFLAFYSYSAVAEVNYLTDIRQPQEVPAVVQEMNISTSSKGGDTYYITFRTEDGKTIKLTVGEEYYTATHVGDEASVYFCEGGLGIPYAFAD